MGRGASRVIGRRGGSDRCVRSTAGVLLCLAVSVGRLAAADPLAPGTVLCLHPPALPIADGEEDVRRITLERELVGALEAADFRVADPEEVGRITAEVLESGAGWIDPVLGVRDESRYQEHRERLAAALREALGCEMRMSAHVVLVRARFDNGLASWDGRTLRISSAGRLTMQALAGTYESGWVAALSLWLSVTDLEGDDVAFRSAGIETLVRLGVLVSQDLLPEDAWLTDEQAIRAAIGSALGPGGDGLRRRGSPGGPTEREPGTALR